MEQDIGGAKTKEVVIMQLLENLLREIQGVDLNDGEPVPSSEVKEGERVIGVLPDNLKQCYVVFSKRGDELTEECDKVHDQFESFISKPFSEAKPEDITLVNQHILAHRRQELIGDIFWHGVKEAFLQDALGDDGLGLRKDWQVVLIPRKHRRPDIIDISILSSLGGFPG